MNCQLAYEVLRIFAAADNYGDLFWKVDNRTEEVAFFAMCNDVFWWATADCDEITEEDLPLLQSCFDDLKAIDKTYYLPELYCARKRGMRPQGAWYRAIHADEKGIAELFDAAGPPRETDILNPAER